MKVAFHAGQLLQPVPGGIGRYEVEVLARLRDFGVDAIAFASGARPGDIPARVPWIDTGWPHGSVRYELWHRLRRPVIRIPADLVHAPSLAVPPVPDRPLVVTAHDVAFLRLPHVTTRRGVEFHRRGLELARRHAQRVIVPSEFTGRELEQEGFDPDRIDVIPFGVTPPSPRTDADIDDAVARAGVRAPYVLTVGTVEPRKDVTTIVNAIASLRRTHPDLTLAVVGPRGWGEVTGLDRSFVRVLGSLPWNTLDALYRRAAAFCSASLYEGFGLPGVEAMAHGAPAVVSTGSSLEEVVRGAGVLFKPGDVDACADALQRVLDDDDLRAELRRAGFARAAELSWERCVELHAVTYARALAHAAP
jgi:glycosyltransferase involved in cell wall biosynthesis